MSTYNEGRKTFTASEAMGKGIIVKLGASAGTVLMADAADFEYIIGVTEYAVASGAEVSIRLLNAGGTFKCKASAAITALDDVILAADGELAPDGGTSTEDVIGQALEAASGDGSIIECVLHTVIVKNLV